MFKSCEYDRPAFGGNYCTLVDDDFVVDILTDGTRLSMFASIVVVYEERNLNVAANYTLALKYWSDNVGWGVSTILGWNRKSPQLAKYEANVEKYLMLV